MKSILFVSLIFVQLLVDLVQTAKFSNQFHQINDDLLSVLDQVLIALKIDKNFTKLENVTDYMAMHNIVQDAVEKNDKKYDKIIETSKTEKCNKTTAYFVSIINEIADEILWKQRYKYISDVFNKSIGSKDNVLTDFLNLGKALNLNVTALSNHLKFWDSKLTKIDQSTRRLYDGNATVIRRFPFMASVHLDGRFVCAGSIVREDMVLTAASCVMQFSRRFGMATIQVRVGSDYTKKYGQLVSVINMWYHPLFNKTTLNHNLVLLRLRRSLELQRRKLIPIKLDRAAEDVPKRAKGVMVLGWGEDSVKLETSERGQRLTKAFVNIYNLDDCTKIYSRTYVTVENFCAGYDDRGSGACKHDIGGPAIVGSTLVGVVSFGSPRCGRARSPTVLTKIGYYADWITRTFDTVPTTKNQEQTKIEIKNDDIESVPSNEYFGLTYKMSISEYFILTKLANDIKIARQNPVIQDFYGELEELDTFKKTKKDNYKNHPLLDKSIVLDPNLVDIPDFSDESEIEDEIVVLETDPPTPEPFKPHFKKDLNAHWDMYHSVLPKLISLVHTTPSTTPPPPPPPEPKEPFEWPSDMLNLTGDEDAYAQFVFETTKLYLPKLTAASSTPSEDKNTDNEQLVAQNEDSKNPKEAPRTDKVKSTNEIRDEKNKPNNVRYLQSSSGETDSDSNVRVELEYQESNKNMKKKKRGNIKVKQKSEIIFVDHGSTRTFDM